MKIALAQIECRLGDVAANLHLIESLVDQAAREGCDLVVIPEMSDTGYEMATIEAHASSWEGGGPFDTLRSLAADRRIAIACGLSERVGDCVYNTLAVIDATGRLAGRYRKTHLFSLGPVHEDKHLAHGESIELVELGGFTLGLMICYDIRFPELARTLTLRGADVLVVCAAWPERRIGHWRTLLAARAIENQVYVAAVNRVGTDGPIRFGGSSYLLDPWGTEVARGADAEPGLVIGEIARDRIVEIRESMAVFEDRRPDLYDHR